MRALAGPAAQLHFSHLSKTSCDFLAEVLGGKSKINEANVECHTIGILELIKERNVPLNRVCLLDPRASKALSPQDATEFDWFLFGVS